MKRDQIIYPLCMDLTKPKATYITHDGYVRPCCYTHRHQKIEADERWMNDPKHNVKSGKSLQEMFDTPEYKDFFERSLSDADPDLFKAINDELVRQQNHIELIASENIVSQAVLEAQGSVLTNKYAEGYPGKRYYNGCEHVDVAEQLALERIKKLFNCKYANVQPHSGAQANGAVFLALLKPNDTFMGMSLNSGGHITHGLKISMSGKWFNAINLSLIHI